MWKRFAKFWQDKQTQQSIDARETPVTIKQYFMGRDIAFPEDYNEEIRKNAERLIYKVNGLLTDLRVERVRVSSGWRPATVNRRIGGAKRSLHLNGKAIDLADSNKELARRILDNRGLLKKWGLWLENTEHTDTWVHLDIGIRAPRPGGNIFKP